MDRSPPGSSVHGIVQEGIGSGLPCPPPGDLPDPGNEFKSPALAGRLFTTELLGKHFLYVKFSKNVAKGGHLNLPQRLKVKIYA